MFNQRRSVPQPEGPSPSQELEPEPFSLIPDAYLAIPEVIQHPPKAKPQTWRWLLVAVLSCFATSAAAIGAFLWLVNLPPTTNCENTASITTERAELYCAQVAAESGELEDVIASLALVKAWGTGHFLYSEAQPLVERWAGIVLEAANQALLNGSLTDAEALVSHIPRESRTYEAGQALLGQWSAEWEAGAALVEKVETALRQKDWGTASAQVRALSELENPYWREDQVQTLSRRIRQEQQAQALLIDAVAMASPGGRDRLINALRLLNQVDTSTFAYEAAQTYIDRWSDLLLDQGLADWYALDLDQAVALGKAVATNPRRAKEAQELIWLSQSRKMARQSVGTWRASPDQLISLYQAMLLANRVPADSRFHPQAQSSVAAWRTHLDGMGQLQLAQLAGRVNQRESLALAISQAEKVPIGHPRRVQAQTLMAHWQQEIERIEDRPHLAKAHELAQDGSLDGLRAAVAEANQISLHRALRGEAQSWIYIWQNQVQTLEDQPILDRAQDLARQGQLSQAIVEASGITPKRALYNDAQAAIATWRSQIMAQDQARQRATQRAMVSTRPPSPAEEEAQEPSTQATPTASTPAASELRPAMAPSFAPAPVPARPTRSTPQLPERIETVAGDDSPLPPSAITPTQSPRPVVPRPIVAEPPAPVPAAQPQPPAPVMTAPPPAPMVAPESPAPVMTAPPPAPVPLSPGSSAAPPAAEFGAPAAEDLQSQRPAIAPAVSVRPQPEAKLRPTLSGSEEVIYTGALYSGL